jgi:hypothetical protein
VKGVAQQEINLRDLKELPAPIATTGAQSEIVRRIETDRPPRGRGPLRVHAHPGASIRPGRGRAGAARPRPAAHRRDLAGNRSRLPRFLSRPRRECRGKRGRHRAAPAAAQQLGRSGDGGVDGVINEDRLGLDRVYVQAKRYAPGNGVGRPDVQGFVGSLVGFGATKGVFVTTSAFSTQARDFVRHLTQRVILIDGQQLADLMIEHNVSVRLTRAVEFKRLDEDFFADEE